jgi:hypothetical protein
MCALLPRGVTHAMRGPAHALRLLAPGSRDRDDEAGDEWGDRDRFYLLDKGSARPTRLPLPPAFSVKARRTGTDGLFSLLEITVAQPVPRHTHHVADECIYILEHRTEVSKAGRFDPAAPNRYTRRYHVAYEEV